MNSRTKLGDAMAKPKRSPARLYDLLNVRVTTTLGKRVKLTALLSAKSAYASSTISGPCNSFASASRAVLLTIVPVGEFGLATSVRCAFGIGHGVGSCQSFVNGTPANFAPWMSAKV